MTDDCMKAFEQYRTRVFGAYAFYPLEACTYFGVGWKARDAEVERLQAALEDARHYAAVCPPPPELTGGPQMEMLARRHRIGMAGAHEQSAPGEREYDPNVMPCDDAEFGMKP